MHLSHTLVIKVENFLSILRFSITILLNVCLFFCLQKFREKLPSYRKKEVNIGSHIWLRHIFVSYYPLSSSSCHSPSTLSHLPPSFHPQELVELINSSRVLVVSGETGCGKTTQVTQFILDDYINRGVGSMCRVVCTQPRRISAISVCALLDFQVWLCGTKCCCCSCIVCVFMLYLR